MYNIPFFSKSSEYIYIFFSYEKYLDVDINLYKLSLCNEETNK